MHRLLVALVPALLLAPLPSAAGELRGTVRFQGTPPALAPLEATKEKALCGDSVPDEAVQVAGGKLRNVVVVVRGAPAPAPSKGVLDQRTCRFVPHVQVLPVGSTLEVVNGDPTLHNVHGYLGQATAFNLAMPSKDARMSRQLKKPGLVVVKCDVHAWMSAYVWVVDAPAAVTGADGTFAISGLPAGTWEVTAWHERLGERKATATIPASGTAELDFTFGN
ncbi:MAG TPA: carboxypeptidase regulatory-like domain-containing protein [Anaeromyxobacteraceae bacterium]|nr:carboxypeptidase regulatory-like domain-containing protein [Anaeromyxobacteraceae bacterium]